MKKFKSFTIMSFCLLNFSLMAMDSIFEAAKNGDVPHLQRCLDSGADINGRSPFVFGMRSGRDRIFIVAPLHVASFYHKTDVVHFLLEKGANVNLVTGDEHQLTALHMLMFTSQTQDQVKIGQILIENNANLSDASFDQELLIDIMPDKKEATEILFSIISGNKTQAATNEKAAEEPSELAQYIEAAKRGNIKQLKEFIAIGVEQKDKRGDALFFALTEYKISIVRYLLDHIKIEIKPRHYFAAGAAVRLCGTAGAKELYQLLKEKDPNSK